MIILAVLGVSGVCAVAVRSIGGANPAEAVPDRRWKALPIDTITDLMPVNLNYEPIGLGNVAAKPKTHTQIK